MIYHIMGVFSIRGGWGFNIFRGGDFNGFGFRGRTSFLGGAGVVTV